MFKSLQEFLNKRILESDTEDASEDKLQLAAATLMIELARADGHMDSAELNTIEDILRQRFALADEDIQTLMELAKQTASDAISLQGFTRTICDRWGNEDRMKLLEYLWIIALADDQIDTNERHLVRKVAGLLYLTDRQIIHAREAAKRA